MLRASILGVNAQNKYGDTPLLSALKHGGSYKFIEQLLSSGAKVTIANNKGITPLSFAIAHCPYMTSLLLERGTDVLFLHGTKLIKKFYNTVKASKCGFETCAINKGLDIEKIVVVIVTSDPLHSDNVVLIELNTFLDYLKTAEDIPNYDFYNICATLLKCSVLNSDTAAGFKTIWETTEHAYMTYMIPNFLHDFIMYCRYENPDFIECLYQILTSACASKFIKKYRAAFNTSFYQDLLDTLFARQINKQVRIQTLLISIQLVNVTVDDIFSAYSYFKFNEELLILLHYFKPEELKPESHSQLRKFIVVLGNDPKLSVSNLVNMNLISKLSYRKLINILPERVFADHEIIKGQKKVLNEVPTLFDLSKHVFQKSVQKFYDVQDRRQFVKVIGNLYLPPVIKRSICHDPPFVLCKVVH